MKNLQGANAIITGASRGLGVHIARSLAREGVNLALVARSVPALKNVRDEIRNLGVNAVAIPADLSDPEQAIAIAEEAEEKIGPVDLLINNAGVEQTANYVELPTNRIQTSVNVNMLSPMLLTRSLLPRMVERGRGHIVNIASLAGKTGLPFQASYSTTKAGLIMFSQSLRMELVDEQVGVSVICPGFVGGSGMYSELEEKGLRAPKLLKPTTIQKVTAAVIRAIKKNRSEIIVNPLPMRPGIALCKLIPGLTPLLHRFIGTNRFARRVMQLDNVTSSE